MAIHFLQLFDYLPHRISSGMRKINPKLLFAVLLFSSKVYKFEAIEKGIRRLPDPRCGCSSAELDLYNLWIVFPFVLFWAFLPLILPKFVIH